MAFFGYLDASGDSIDPQTRVISVSGFIAHESQWVEFERRWKAVLEEFGVSELHMKHFAHSLKEYENWRGKKDMRDSFMLQLTDIINDCTRHSVGVSIVRNAYDNCNDDHALKEGLGSPYAIAAVHSVSMAIQWHRDQKITEPLLLMIEKGDTDQSDFTKFIKKFGGWKGFDLVTEPIFQHKKWKDAEGNTQYCVPFQSSDFLAYEHTKMFTDLILHGKRKVRESLFKVSFPHQNRHSNRLLSTAALKSLIKRFGIATRWNHPSNFNDDVTLPLDPLCYMDMIHPIHSYSSRQAWSRQSDRAAIESRGLVLSLPPGSVR